MRILCIATALLFIACPLAAAQETVDIAKVTCQQFVAGQIVDSRTLAVWLSGYYHGEQKNTLFNVSTVPTISDVILDYCLSHPDTLLMEAVKKAVPVK